MPRTYTFRVLRSDFIDMCDGDTTAALVLDYFWGQGRKLEERHVSDPSATPYIPFGWGYARKVLLIKVSRNTIKAAVALLARKGYITPHPGNGQVGANQINRYGVNTSSIQRDINIWSEAAPSVYTDLPLSVQTYPSVSTDLPPRSVQTYPLSPQTYPLGLYRPHESVREVVDDLELESAAAATAPPPPPSATSTIDSLITAYLGRQPSPLELQRAASLVKQHGHERTRAAIEDAAAKGGRSIKYVEQIANDINPRQATNDAAAPEADWSNYRRVLPEEAATMLRGAGRKGGAS